MRTIARVCALAGLCAQGCVFRPPPPLPEEVAEEQAAAAARRAALQAGEAESPGGEAGGEAAARTEFQRGEEPDLGMTPEEMRAYATAQGDPEGGDFTLDEALADLPGTGRLYAEFYTTAGVITCRLFEKRAPITVANFIGLARGLRPFLDPTTDTWQTRRYYDGVEFHRVIPGFMIQGGDPTGTGRGGTGYVIPDEFSMNIRHDAPGMLSMANRGPGSGSAQFFITLAPVPHLDEKHTIFGECDDKGIEVAEAIAATAGPGDRPKTTQLIERVEIVRR